MPVNAVSTYTILPAKFFYQFAKGFFLCIGTGVLRGLTVCRTATDIANTDTAGIVPGAVRAYGVNISACVYASVPVDYEVVAYAVKAALAVPLVYLLHCKIFAFWRGRAVQNNFVNWSHISIRFVVLVVRSFYAHIVLDRVLFLGLRSRWLDPDFLC